MIKWIGQHIVSLIARFRSDVYLEDIADGTVADDKFLGLDSNNKIVKETITSSSGDIEGVTAGNALTGGGTSGTVTINHEDTSSQASVNNSGRTYIQDVTLDTYGHVTGLTSATETVTNTDTDTLFNMDSADGGEEHIKAIRLAATNNTDHAATSVNLAVGTGLSIARDSDSNTITFTNTVSDTNTQLTTEQVQDIAGPLVATGGTKSNITVSYQDSTGDMDFIVADAREDLRGVIELATTSEADTGTDTARAVTPAGLKSHVDTRFTYQYITFTGNADTDEFWATPGTNGPFTHNYNTATSASETSVGSTTHNFARSKQNGFVVPYDNAVLVGFYGMIRNNTENNQGALGLFHSTYATFGAKTTTSTFTLQAYAAADQTGGAGSSYQGQCKAVDLSRSLDLTAGDIIIPAIMQASEKAYAQFTIVIKTPII